MPFDSKAQSRAAFGGYLGSEMKSKAKEFADKTDYDEIPDKVSEAEGDKKDFPINLNPSDKEKQDRKDRLLKQGRYSRKTAHGVEDDTDEGLKENHMKLTEKLLEAIRAKNWHEANVLFERSMQARVIARVNDIKKRVMMEDAKRCEMCGSDKNVSVLDDGTAICKACDIEECPEDTKGGIDKDMTKAPFMKEADMTDSTEKGDGTDNGGLKEESEECVCGHGVGMHADGTGACNSVECDCTKFDEEK